MIYKKILLDSRDKLNFCKLEVSEMKDIINKGSDEEIIDNIFYFLRLENLGIDSVDFLRKLFMELGKEKRNYYCVELAKIKQKQILDLENLLGKLDEKEEKEDN